MLDKIEFKRLSQDATLPDRGHPDDAGLDIYAAETVILDPQEKRLINTDLAVNIPKGYVGLLTSRSGVSSKTELVVETGKIDAGFQGHMKVSIKNGSQDWYGTKHSERLLDIQNEEIMGSGSYAPYQIEYQITKGDKIAQLLIVPIVTPEAVEVEEFTNTTARGEQGFGSTGY
ncbi:dUTP diphosphatase [Mammaliicoccus sciuri]|uniref:dUTP diphosphatase n=1 Tax=Mammaliicoccus sciuri TaxID=1296 RepID=UPI003A9396F0